MMHLGAQVLWGSRLAAVASLLMAERSGHQQAVPCVLKSTLETLSQLLGTQEELGSLEVPMGGCGGVCTARLGPCLAKVPCYRVRVCLRLGTILQSLHCRRL